LGQKKRNTPLCIQVDTAYFYTSLANHKSQQIKQNTAAAELATAKRNSQLESEQTHIANDKDRQRNQIANDTV
jgi:hypothetical protein